MEKAKEVLTKVITELAEGVCKTIIQKAGNALKDMEKKEDIDSQGAYEEYLAKVYETYSKSKSIIYINEAREIKKFFIPSDIEYIKHMPKNGVIRLLKPRSYKLSGKNIKDVFTKSNKIIITGIGGLGKTMHMKHFCISAIESGFRIPVFLPLRWFNDCETNEKPLEKLIYDRLTEFGFRLEYEYFEYSLESDKYVFLLDGFDEVRKEKISRLSVCIQNFIHRYSSNSFIISSREIDDIYGWDEFIVYSLCPLNYKQAAQLIWKLDFASDLKKGFIDAFTIEVYEKYIHVSSVPLLLSIMYLTYVDNGTFPDSIDGFYEKAFETMLYGHDRRQKSGFEREFASGLSYTDFKKVFMNFCFKSYFNGDVTVTAEKLINYIDEVKGVIETTFDAYAYKNDLINVVCMLFLDGFEYNFIHRSFQEYFAAKYVSINMLEEEQKEFCSAFINMPENNAGPLISDQGLINPKRDKTIDFLNMLKYNNPKVFEHVVLSPILNKIYDRFLESRKDLIVTLASYFIFGNELFDEDTFTYSCNLGFKKGNNTQLTYNEFNVLSYYYLDLYKASIMGSREGEIRNMVSENSSLIESSLIDEYFVENENLETVITMIELDYNQGREDLIIELFLFFDCLISKYELLKNNNNKGFSFRDRVNNPIFYKH